MISVLIVDNEHIVVDSLIAYFDKKGNVRITTQGAYSAQEALQILEHTRIDVLVTDIHMPGMDGLQLQKEVNKRWPDCLTIFLSGYQNFDYVQEAMRNNCFDYILKTENSSKVYDTVIAAVKKLDERLSNARVAARTNALMQRAVPLLHERMLNDMLSGTMQRPPEFHQSDISLDRNSMWLVLIHFDDWTYQHSDVYDSLDHLSQVYVENTLRTASVALVHRTNGFALLISFPSQSESNTERCFLSVQSASETMQEHLLDQREISVSCCIARKDYSWDEISVHYQAMERQLALARGYHRGMLLTEKEVVPDPYIPGKCRAQMKKVAQLAVLLDTGNRESLFIILHEIMMIPEQLTGQAQAALREEIFHTILALLIRESNELQIESTLTWVHPLMNHWCNQAPWYVLEEYIKETADRILDYKKQCVQGEDLSFVYRLERIINANPGGDLSLTRLGDQVGMNPYYMARLYRQLTGKHLKQYISQVKYNKACEMLKKGLSNRAVTEALGFHAEQSFNRFFKALSGKTPGEYRENK